jgi:hypothetical protein
MYRMSQHPNKPFNLITLNSLFVAVGCSLFTILSLKAFDTSDWQTVHFTYWTFFTLTNFFLISWIDVIPISWTRERNGDYFLWVSNGKTQ